MERNDPEGYQQFLAQMQAQMVASGIAAGGAEKDVGAMKMNPNASGGSPEDFLKMLQQNTPGVQTTRPPSEGTKGTYTIDF